MIPKSFLDRLIVLLLDTTIPIIHRHHMVRLLLLMVPTGHLTVRPDLIVLTAPLLRHLDSVESRRILLLVTCSSTYNRGSGDA